MDLLCEFGAGFLVALGTLLFIFALKLILFSPTKPGKYTDITILVGASKDHWELSRIIRNLTWLNKIGILKARILIVDHGMNEETKQASELISRDFGIPVLEKYTYEK